MKLNKNITGHIIAFIIVIGFFLVLFTVLLGFVDIKDPVVVSFAGTIIGYCAGNIAPVAKFYFGHEENYNLKSDKNEITKKTNTGKP